MAKNDTLFSEFPPVTRKEWEEKITVDLKGAPYKRLITKTIEGIDLKPYYHKEDIENLSYLNTLPGEFPYTRSGKIQLNDWNIRQDILVEDVGVSNKNALSALNKGANSLAFIFPESFIIKNDSLGKLLNDIWFERIELRFISESGKERIFEQFIGLCEEKKIGVEKIRAGLNSDPLTILTKKGTISEGITSSFDRLSERISIGKKSIPGFKQLFINADMFHNAGSSTVQELAMALSMAAENFHQLIERGRSVDEIAANLELNFSVGSSYFMEIAKFRAARLLFAHFIRSYNPVHENLEKVFIHSTSSEWNQTLFDPYVNMLRGTTESMSAILGCVDSLSVSPFDKAFRKPTEFSERIARNTQIILKEEAHLDKIVDPAAGSYYIENLTDEIAGKAWEIFLEIEDDGGYLEALKKGKIQEMIEETARKRDMNIAIRKEILLGTNQYPNQTEKPLTDSFSTQVAKDSSAENTDIKTIKKYRGAKVFETLRLKTESLKKKPVVFLLSYGNVSMRKARAGFASGFFACAGYKIIDSNGFESIEAGMKAAGNASADIIVLCASDEDYPFIAPESKSKLKNGQILVVAGYPKDSLDDLKEKGISNFIHVRSNLLEELNKFNSLLGIN